MQVRVEIAGPMNPVPYGVDGVTVVGAGPLSDVGFFDDLVYLAPKVVVDLGYLPPHVDWELALDWVNTKLFPAIEDDGELTICVSPHLAQELVDGLKRLG